MRAADGGIVVDEHMQSSVPGVYAAGDVCSVTWSQSPYWFQVRLLSIHTIPIVAHSGRCADAVVGSGSYDGNLRGTLCGAGDLRSGPVQFRTVHTHDLFLRLQSHPAWIVRRCLFLVCRVNDGVSLCQI